MVLDSLQSQLCDIQGRLFELSAREGYDSIPFIATFMSSETARNYDRPYNYTQWMGEEYLLEEITDNACPDAVPKSGDVLSREALYWIGYVYRYWHFLTGESSKEIYAQADAATMAHAYPGLHTLDTELAIENLRELAAQ